MTPFTATGPVGPAMTGLAASRTARREKAFILKESECTNIVFRTNSEGLANIMEGLSTGWRKIETGWEGLLTYI